MFFKTLRRSSTSAPRTSRRRPLSLRPTFECLEERQVPTVFVWDGGGANNNWNNAANWHIEGTNTDQIPNGAVIDLIFPGGAPADSKATVNTLGSGFAVNSIRFEDDGYSISQDAIAIGAGGITSVTGSNTINTQLTLQGSAADLVPFDVQGGATGNLFLAGRVTGAPGLDKTGSGRLGLQAVNGYSGKTLVQAGTLFVHTGSTGGESPLGGTAGVTEVKANATLALTGSTSYTILNETLLLEGTLSNRISQNLTWKGNVTLNGDATLDMDQVGFSLNVDGVISGAAANDLTKVGAGTVTFKGNTSNTYAGATRVNEGTLALNKPSGVTAVAGDLFVGDGLGANDSDRVILLPQTVAGVTVPKTGNNQIDPSNSKTVFVASTGLLDLNDNSDVVGTLELTAGHVTTGTGVFSVSEEVITRAATSSAVIDGHVKLLRSSASGDTPFTIENGSAGLDLVVNADLLINTNTAVFGIVKRGPGTMQLNAANSYDGQTLVQDGILEITDVGGLGVVDTSSAANVQLANTIVENTGTLEIDNDTQNFSIPEAWTLRNGGRLTMESSGAGEGTVTLTGAIRVLGTGNRIDGTTNEDHFVLSGRIFDSGDVELSDLTVGGTLDNFISGQVTIGGTDVKFSKPAGVDAVGTGAALVIDDSELLLTANNQIPDEVLVTVQNDGVLNLNNFNETIGTLNLNGGDVQTGTATLRLLGDTTSTGLSRIAGKLELAGIDTTQDFHITNGRLDVDAVVSGIRGIEKDGTGDMMLSAANLYGGFTQVVEGVLIIENGNALSPSIPSNLNITTVAPGATLRLAGGAYTVNEIIQLQGNGSNNQGAIENANFQDHTLADNITLTGDTKIGGNGTLTITGRISGGSAANPFDLTFDGNEFVLAGTEANIYSGNTILTRGTLVLDKSIGTDAIPATQLIIGDGTGTDTVRLDRDVQIPDTTQIVINSSGRLDYNDEDDQIGLLTLNGGRLVGTTGTLFLNSNVVAAVTNNQVPRIDGNIGLLTGTHVFDVADDAGAVNDLIVNGVISSTGALTKIGPGRLELQGTTGNTYTGTTRVNEGTLSLAKTASNALAGSLIVGDGVGGANADVVLYQSGDQIANTQAVTVLASGFLDLNGNSDTINALTMTAGVVETDAGVLTLGGNVTVNTANVPATIRGKLNWASSRTFQVANGGAAHDLLLEADLLSSGLASFQGFGTTLVTGDSLTLGTINILGGSTVLVNGTHGGNVAMPLNADANFVLFDNTLGGTGTINGSVTLNRQNLSPGDSTDPATLTILGNVIFTDAFFDGDPLGALIVDVNGLAGAGVAGGHDLLVVEDGVTLGTKTELRIGLGFTPTVAEQGTSFLIVQNLSNTLISGQFANAPDSLTDADAISDVTISVGGKEFFVNYAAGNGNDIALIYHAGQNDAEPILTPIGNQTVDEGGTLSFTAQATDADGDQLTFRLAEGAPAGANIDPISGQFTFTATDGPGSDPVVVTVIVSDNGFPAFETAATFVIAVNNVAPTVNAGPDSVLLPGQTFSSNGTILDVPDDLLSATVNYGDGTGDQPLPINEDGTFDLSHTYSSPGVFTVTVIGLDDDGAQGTDTAQVRVLAPFVPPVVTPPAPPAAVGTLLTQIGAGKKKKLGVRVQFSGGLPSREIVSPFQKPTFQAVAASLHDLNGDGVFDSVLFTGRRGGKKFTRTVAL